MSDILISIIQTLKIIISKEDEFKNDVDEYITMLLKCIREYCIECDCEEKCALCNEENKCKYTEIINTLEIIQDFIKNK